MFSRPSYRPVPGSREHREWYIGPRFQQRYEQFREDLQPLRDALSSNDLTGAISFLDNLSACPRQWEEICFQVTEQYAMFHILSSALYCARIRVIHHLLEDHVFAKGFRRTAVQYAGHRNNEFMQTLLLFRPTRSPDDDKEIAGAVHYFLRIAGGDDVRPNGTSKNHPGKSGSSSARRDKVIPESVKKIASDKIAVTTLSRPPPPTGESDGTTGGGSSTPPPPTIITAEWTPLAWTLISAGWPRTARVLVKNGADIGEYLSTSDKTGHTNYMRDLLFIPTHHMATVDGDDYFHLLSACWKADARRYGPVETNKLWNACLQRAFALCCQPLPLPPSSTEGGDEGTGTETVGEPRQTFKYWYFDHFAGVRREFDGERLYWALEFLTIMAGHVFIDAVDKAEQTRRDAAALERQQQQQQESSATGTSPSESGPPAPTQQHEVQLRFRHQSHRKADEKGCGSASSCQSRK